jgi:iron complex transport system ATP-binding protein
MIAAEHLSLIAGERVLLRDVAFHIEQGEFVAVLGPNGAGKTTLLRTLAGVRVPDAGKIILDRRDVAQLNAAERARLIAHITSDDLFIDQLRVRDVVAMGRYAHHRWWQWHEEPGDESAIGDAIESVGMAGFAQRRFDTLSSGERQRIWIALGLAQAAPLLLLDEPTSHLDIHVAHDILALLRAQARSGKTVVCVLHDLNEAAEFSDRLLLIGDGHLLAFDTPESVLQSRVIERAYGIEMEIVRTPSDALRVFPRSDGGRARQA